MTHVYVFYVIKNITRMHVFYAKHVHIIDIRHKTHKYISFIYIIFYFKTVFRTVSKNLFKYPEKIFSNRIIPDLDIVKQIFRKICARNS